MKKLKQFLILLILFTLFIIVSAFSYVNGVSTNVSENLLRLHVIANSNSPEDQELKYLIRDQILLKIGELTSEFESLEETVYFIENNLSKIEVIAENAMHLLGHNYNINISLGNFHFPTTSYANITLPPGFYNALRVEIEEAKGDNWWCVMFPPLCFTSVSSGVVPESSRDILDENLYPHNSDIIFSDNTQVRFKFRLVESIREYMAIIFYCKK